MWDPTQIDLTGQTIIITGASSGIGLEAARVFARQGGHVIAAVRNTGKAEAAIDFPAEVRRLDVSDLGSIHSFAERTTESIDLLINNAGVMAIPFAQTVDGFEMQFGTNHLGHFALTNLLLPRISGRVVTVSSSAHRMGRINLDDLNSTHGYRPWRAYGQSKLANLLFTSELQRRLLAAGSPVLAMAAHPGYANTNLQGQTGRKRGDAMARWANTVAQSAAMGALPIIYAATAAIPGDSYVGPDGFAETRGRPTLVPRSRAALDSESARALWRSSEALTGVPFPL
jgi:NAD(P)-dependent dehydrogenase (short-subunit alcohol dehydrogenase family)